MTLSFCLPACAALAVSGLLVAAEDLAVNPSELAFSSRAWETDDSMPHNGIPHRSDGFLWVGTQGGLVRFDGIEFVQRRSPLLASPRSSRVVESIEENSFTLLAACDSSGLVRLTSGGLSVHRVSESLGLERRVVSLFRETAGSELAQACEDGGACGYHG
jgi:hypothetical protein